MEWFEVESRWERRAPENLSGRDGAVPAVQTPRNIDQGCRRRLAHQFRRFPGDGGPHEHGRSPGEAGRDTVVDCPGVPDHCSRHSIREPVFVQPAAARGRHIDNFTPALNLFYYFLITTYINLI